MNFEISMKLLYKYLFSVIVISLLISSSVYGQAGEYPHPELKWFTMETDHFTAYYHEGTERVAKTCLKIGEEIYAPITELYGYEPDTKIHFVIKDTDDYSNGGAYYYDNKILIWATALDWDLRGDHNWLRNVVSHEFSHMIQLGASRKAPRQIPGVYMQWLNYEEERRPDVLYGFPNTLVSYPIAMTVIPSWFAEGCAQNQAPGFGYDIWDSHRDMILRTRVLNGTLLTLEEMGHFGFNSIGNESIYNQGFSLVSYIRNSYGDKSLADISAGMKSFWNYSFDKAVRSSIGIGSQELYKNWVDSLRTYYNTAAALIKDNQTAGDILPMEESFGNFYPTPITGDKVLFLSNQGRDYLSLTDLYQRSLSTGDIKLVKKTVKSRMTVDAGGKLAVYSSQRKPHNRSMYDDIYLLDLTNNKEYRLTIGARASDPAISPDGKKIAFAYNFGGTKNLGIADLVKKPLLRKGKSSADSSEYEYAVENWKILTEYKNGEQIAAPSFSPDNSRIVYEYWMDAAKDIHIYFVDGGWNAPLLDQQFDERNPVFSPDGQKILYSSDETGIFNIYAFDTITARSRQLTNVLGGAFQPAFTPENQLVYTGYVNDGFQLFRIVDPNPIDETKSIYLHDYSIRTAEITYDDTDLPDYSKVSYKPAFGKLFFLPRFTWDLNAFKPGFYVYSSDFMDWFSFFGGFAFNGLTEDPKFFQSIARINPQYLGDYDLFAIIEYNNIVPTVFVEGYNILRKTHQEFEDNQHIIGEYQTPGGEYLPIYDKYAIDYRFTLSEADAGFRYKYNQYNHIELRGVLSKYGAKLRFDDGFEFAYSYFKGRSVSLKWTGDHRLPSIEQEINPDNGRRFVMEIARENNAFIDSFRVDAGLLEEVYTDYSYNRFSIQWEEYKKSPLAKHHSINLRFNAAGLDRDNLDDFFYLYAGGLPGMKGYSYYSLGGTKKMVGTLSYRFPLVRNFHRRYAQAYIHSVYMGMFFDYGNAWAGDLDFGDFKKDAGINLRADLTSFYNFPTAVSLEAAYGLDKFTVEQPDFTRVYGHEWRYYLTILFGFSLFLGNR